MGRRAYHRDPSIEHLEQAVEALEIDLSDADIAHLEELYEPVPVDGHD